MIHSEWIKLFCILGFVTLLLLLDYPIWPVPVFHFLRDIVLRILGTTMIVILFASHASVFNQSGRIVSWLVELGKVSLPIYLLQYFFMPDLLSFPNFINGADQFTIHVVSAVYTILITLICYAFVKVLDQSKFVRRYVLGLK